MKGRRETGRKERGGRKKREERMKREEIEGESGKRGGEWIEEGILDLSLSHLEVLG